MGRKNKVELFGLVERVISLYDNEHKTLEEIETILRDDGFDLSRESIRRSLKSSREVAEQYRRAVEESKVIIETVRNNPNTDVVETITSMLAGQLFEYVKSVDALQFKDPKDMVGAIKDLANSQVKLSKFRLDFQKGYDTAKKDFLESLQKELEDHPELLSQLTNIVAGMEAGS